MMYFAAALIVSTGMSWGQEPNLIVDFGKFEKCKEFTVNMDSGGSLSKFLAENERDYYYVDTIINDRNFPKDTKINGQKIFVIFHLVKYAECEEIIAFAEQSKLSFVDAHALAVIFGIIDNQKIIKIPNNRGIIAMNYLKNLYHDCSQGIFKSKERNNALVPYIAKQAGMKWFGAGSFNLGCNKNSYLIFYKEMGSSQELSKN